MRSKVAIAQDDDIHLSINEALRRLDGLEGLIKNKHVAIKPNDTWASPRDLTACTQADTLEAVIRYVKQFRPAKITVSGGAGAAETDDVFGLLGLDRVIKAERVEFFDHNRPPFKSVKLSYGPQSDVMVNPRVFAYDTLISLAQLKLHDSATVTLTMKNIAMSYPAGDYYGHSRENMVHPHHFFKDLHGFIAGMCQRFHIGLGIIVGHPAMVGTGPIGGEAVETGLTIASTDAVAADFIGAKLLARDNVRHIKKASELGLGTASLENIAIEGMALAEAKEFFQERIRSVMLVKSE